MNDPSFLEQTPDRIVCPRAGGPLTFPTSREPSFLLSARELLALVARPNELDHLGTVGGIVDDRDTACSKALCRGPEDNINPAGLANGKNVWAVIGLGEVSAGDNA